MHRLFPVRRRPLRLAVVTVLLTSAVVGSYAVRLAFAGSAGRVTRAFAFQYAAKFACAPEVGPARLAFEPGNYRTVINVHNPLDSGIGMAKKAVVANREGATSGIIGQVRTLDLKPDGAFDIDCKDIVGLLGGGAQAVGDGFVVLFSNSPLDVWAVYSVNREVTSSSGGQGVGEGVDVERVPCTPGIGQCPLG